MLTRIIGSATDRTVLFACFSDQSAREFPIDRRCIRKRMLPPSLLLPPREYERIYLLPRENVNGYTEVSIFQSALQSAAERGPRDGDPCIIDTRLRLLRYIRRQNGAREVSDPTYTIR